MPYFPSVGNALLCADKHHCSAVVVESHVSYFPSDRNALCVVVVFFTLTDRASTIPSNIHVVANPVRGHNEAPRSTGHIMVTTRYSNQQGFKSRPKVMRLYKRWHRPITKRFIKLPYSISRAASIDSVVRDAYRCCAVQYCNR